VSFTVEPIRGEGFGTFEPNLSSKKGSIGHDQEGTGERGSKLKKTFWFWGGGRGKKKRVKRYREKAKGGAKKIWEKEGPTMRSGKGGDRSETFLKKTRRLESSVTVQNAEGKERALK